MTANPKTLLYDDALAAVERRIVDALPEIVDGLIARAKEGDTKAAVYLCDRILGRAAGSVVAPAEDRRAPYSEDSFALDRLDEQARREMRRRYVRSGATNGA